MSPISLCFIRTISTIVLLGVLQSGIHTQHQIKSNNSMARFVPEIKVVEFTKSTDKCRRSTVKIKHVSRYKRNVGETPLLEEELNVTTVKGNVSSVDEPKSNISEELDKQWNYKINSDTPNLEKKLDPNANSTEILSNKVISTNTEHNSDVNSGMVHELPGGIYHNISTRPQVRSNVSHRPEIKHRNEHNPNINKFTIQDTFDVLKHYDSEHDGDSDISKLIKYVMEHYLSKCMIIFLYDELFYASVTLRVVITEILEYSPLPVMHGMINTSGLSYTSSLELLDPPERKCRNFLVLTKSLENSADLLGRQRESKVVFVAYMSSYQIKSFLADPLSHNIVNLLIVADPNLQQDEFDQKSEFYTIDLYTHRLYTDSLGTSVPWILTSWRNGNFTRSWVNLFPDKLNSGFQGHRFIVSVAKQPPFVFRRQKFEHDNSGKIIQIETDEWDGLEVKILKHMSEFLNITIELRETSSSNPGDGGSGRVIYDIMQDKAILGLAGIPVTTDRLHNVSFSTSHYQDCAVFITQTSLALSKYRAIFGPFRWEVWVCLVLVYLLAIIPLSYSDKLTLRHLWEKPSEIENMFWYMFGTFTNLFTFRNVNSWTSSKKASTRALVGTYWVFSIIITAAYTGSIIAFITMPVFPDTIDTLRQLKSERYRIVSLDSGGWQSFNDTEEETLEAEVFQHWELVASVEDGLRNVTEGHLLWNYAFLGSRAQLEHIIRNNFESNLRKKRRKRKKFHISRQCYQPMFLGLAYSKKSLLNTQLDRFILKAQQSGLMNKWMRDVQWDNWRNSKGGRFQAGNRDIRISTPEDRMLTLDDTLGMFLLLAFGYTLALIAFINECLTHYNKRIFGCVGTDHTHPPTNPRITLTDNTPETSAYDLSSPENRLLIVRSISPHRRYSMTQIDDRILEAWAKRRQSC